MRVSQLDSHILDQELLALLATNIDSALSLFKTNRDVVPVTLKTLLRAAIWKIGIWDHGTTYGAQMQQLRYTNLTTTKKLVLGVVTVFGPLLSDAIQGELSPRIRRVISKFEAVYELCTLLNFVSFIAGSRYDSLIHRILRIQLRPTTNAYRAVSFEFLNRQLVWSQFTEFLLVFLPLLNLPRLKQKIRKYLPKHPRNLDDLKWLPRRKCAICHLDGTEFSDIVSPYVADCGDIFCYACIVGQLEVAEGEGWECVRCGKLVKSASLFEEKDDSATGSMLHHAVSQSESDTTSEDDEADTETMSDASHSDSGEELIEDEEEEE